MAGLREFYLHMNFCSHCGSDQLEERIPDGDDRLRIVCRNCHTVHYSNPKIVAGCLPIWEDQVLLCRRSIPPRKGYWNIPSGYLEHAETVEEGALREVWEEARARVEILQLHAIFSIPHIGQVYLHFLAQLTEPDFSPGPESLEVQLFRESEIPWDQLAFSSSRFSLKHYWNDRRAGFRQVHLGGTQYDLLGNPIR